MNVKNIFMVLVVQCAVIGAIFSMREVPRGRELSPEEIERKVREAEAVVVAYRRSIGIQTEEDTRKMEQQRIQRPPATWQPQEGPGFFCEE